MVRTYRWHFTDKGDSGDGDDGQGVFEMAHVGVGGLAGGGTV